MIVADDREGAEGVALGVDPLEHLANRLVWGDRDRFLDQAVDVVLDAADLLELLLVRHVVVNQAKPPFRAMPMAMRDSVTVSMSAETIGMCRVRPFASSVSSEALRGKISE